MRQLEIDSRKTRPTTLDRIMGKPGGLCSTCLLTDGCTYPRTAGQIVRHCGEFAGATKPEAAKPPKSSAPSNPGNPRRPGVLGLCANCARFEGCRYPKSESGVWQCDEYA